MKILGKLLIWMIVIAAAGFGLFKAYEYNMAAEGAADAQKTQDEAAPPLVRVAEVENGTVERSIYVTGTVEADESARVTPELNGVLEEFCLPDGTPVREGLEHS